MQLSNTFFIKVQKTSIKFVFFFIIAIIGWFILVPNFIKAYIMISVVVSTLSALLLTIIVDTPSYKHVVNVFKCFFKWNFYKYLSFMFKEIMLSTCDVLKCGLTFSRKYHSQILVITLPNSTPLNKVLLVIFSITITPGTTVVDSDKENITVHCLTKNTYSSMKEMTFIKKVISFNF